MSEAPIHPYAGRRTQLEPSLPRLQKILQPHCPRMKTMARLLQNDEAPARVMEILTAA